MKQNGSKSSNQSNPNYSLTANNKVVVCRSLISVPTLHAHIAVHPLEQKKATLRRVGMELEEAEEIVSPLAIIGPWRLGLRH